MSQSICDGFGSRLTFDKWTHLERLTFWTTKVSRSKKKISLLGSFLASVIPRIDVHLSHKVLVKTFFVANKILRILLYV